MVRVSRNGDKLAIYDVTPYNLRRIDEHNKSLNGSINDSINGSISKNIGKLPLKSLSVPNIISNFAQINTEKKWIPY